MLAPSDFLIAINHCYYCYCTMIINLNILLMQVINANILKPKGMLYNMVLIQRQNTTIKSN